MERIDRHDAGPNISVEETAGTTTGVNRGEDVVHNDEPNVFDAFEDDEEAIDSSFHTHYAVRPNASAPKSKKHTRTPPFFPHHRLSNQTQAAPKITPSLRHPGHHIRSSDIHGMRVDRYLQTRQGESSFRGKLRVLMSVLWTSFDEVGFILFYSRFFFQNLTLHFIEDALQRHWNKYCPK